MMKFTLKSLLLLILVGISTIGLYAQQGILTASGNAAGTGGSVSWSIGQVAYLTLSDTTGSVTEGLQQPFEIYQYIGIPGREKEPGCQVFPNPTDGKVTLKFSDPDIKGISYAVYDITGLLLSSASVENQQVSIGFDHLIPASYILLILKNDTPVKTYKIVKK
jgi:hypothetical protein